MIIDPKTQYELRSRFNPEGSDLRKIQMRLLEMLKYLDKMCRDNNIKYWLSSGTCLGAVRHGGFIPWDDDVDIEMCAKDFRKLRQLITTQSTSAYQWQDIETDSSYFLPFAKLRDRNSYIDEIGNTHEYDYNGLFIDIFVITPSNSVRWREFTTRIYSTLINKRFLSFSLKKSVRNRLIPFMELFQKIHSKGIYRHISGTYFYKERYYEDFKNISYVKFEDMLLPIPSNFHHYLTKIYSNYEEIPDLMTIQPHLSNVKFL